VCASEAVGTSRETDSSSTRFSDILLTPRQHSCVCTLSDIKSTRLQGTIPHDGFLKPPTFLAPRSWEDIWVIPHPLGYEPLESAFYLVSTLDLKSLLTLAP
jgi:hypothetical protein